MARLTEHSTVVVAEGQTSCDLGDEAVILSLKAGVYYGLNSVASRVWSLVQQPALVSSIRDALVEEYDVDPERCERDLLLLLRELVAKELIRATADETAT